MATNTPLQDYCALLLLDGWIGVGRAGGKGRRS